MTEYLTITEAAAALRAGEISSVELTQRCLEVADAHDSELGCFLARFDEQALAAADAADTAFAAGDPVGLLNGIPLGVKDIIQTREAATTAQSLILDPAWSDSGQDAVVVQRLRAAGAVITGKLTTMEFAIGIADPTKPFPTPRNPWDTQRWAGGSSSGSGSAVSTSAVLGALGTDTGGSIRIPAAFCGITGLKPTFGRVPKSGCVPFGYSLDHIGPMARSARDCAVMLSVMAGHDVSDPSSLDEALPDYLAALTGDLHGVRIGYDRLTRVAGDAEDPALPAAFQAALAVLSAAGAEVVEIELPFYAEMTAADVVIMLSDALAYHLPDLQTRWSDYFAATRNTLASAILFAGGDVVQAQRARRAGQKALAAVYRDVDLIITPTCSAGAPTFAELGEMIRGQTIGGAGPIHTMYWDTTGNPVLTVPIGFTADAVPLGMQIAGRPFEETTVLCAGDAYQAQTFWHGQLPPVVTDGPIRQSANP